MRYFLLLYIFLHSGLFAHQNASDTVLSSSVIVKTSSATIAFNHSANTVFKLEEVTVNRDNVTYKINASELKGITKIDFTKVILFKGKDNLGAYFYIDVTYGVFDPLLYGKGHKGGYRYVRFLFRDGKYIQRKILNGQQTKPDGSTYIEYLTKKVGMKETASFK